MNAKKRDIELLHDILEAVANIATHQKSDCAEFTKERAIVFELVIIGEATKNLSSEIKNEYSMIEWHRIAGARNRMVHNYEDISSKVVQDIVANHLSELKSTIENILKKRQGS